ncbi:MAG: aminotransferase class III-fold pyridoxal phosphate-dependent enzyme, partial [Cyclobacteriaceae bacterium]|nr:aminotransferase class III-fold pyridoxal phosphate-dependent enzyme [Cyclobacteriaceae bacterium]
RLNKMKGKYPVIGDVRGIGLLMGIELIENGEKALETAETIMYQALEKGLNFKLTMGNIITLTPALTITREEMDKALDILEDCFKEFLTHKPINP